MGIFLSISGIVVLGFAGMLLYSSSVTTSAVIVDEPVILKSAWSSRADPFSNVNPTDIGFRSVDRPASTKPGEILSNLISINKENEAPETPLPTNSWYENLILGDSNTDPENKVFQIPYVVDAAGFIPGVRSHPCHLQSNDRVVLMNFEPESGMTLGATETFLKQHHVHKHSHGTPFTISKLAIELEWVSKEYDHKASGSESTRDAHSVGSGPSMRAPIVRGAPYTSMKYLDATPRLFVQRKLSGPVQVDQGTKHHQVLECGDGEGNYSKKPVLVQRELKVQFDTSDMTWLIFVSEPTEFTCANYLHDPSHDPPLIPGWPISVDAAKTNHFDLKATAPMHRGMVRVAMSNNCTMGQNPQHCLNHQPSDQKGYEKLLRDHAEVYPTAKADIGFTFPVSSSEEEELRLTLNWRPSTMSSIRSDETDDDGTDQQDENAGMKIPSTELLMFALPHHQERLRPIVGSSNAVQKDGCQRNIHGTACPALGGSWSLVEHLHRTSFSAPRTPREEMIPAIQASLQTDIHYSPPENYMSGAGDTYFSGKILAKLARILLVANQVGGVDRKDFTSAVHRLRAGVEIWLNGSAASPMLYDRAWGGIVMCGCDYYFEHGKGGCRNKFPDCPALSDAGQNFGAGFYNDHHYHFGYHIYAAAVVAKFDSVWGRKFNEHVLMLVRDIVNPSDDDKYFPTWRHKDWYLGFSWASGIVTIGGKPYPNGRNQESASEAIAAYEAVAMYGDVMSNIFDTGMSEVDAQLLQTSLRIRDIGRLLMATEVRSTQTYWHVQAPDTKGVSRIYPEAYQPKVIGMMWSMLAQLQTWFGNEEWKSYGIQLMPITPASELRDTGSWMAEMLPRMTASCTKDKDCLQSGWAVLIYTCLGVTGHWKEAWRGLNGMNATFFEDAGGNGHSLSNSLWYVATRPFVTVDETSELTRNVRQLLAATSEEEL